MNIALLNFGSAGLFHYAALLAKSLATEARIDSITLFTSSLNSLSFVPSHPKIKVISYPVPHTLSAFLRWITKIKAQQAIRRQLRSQKFNIIQLVDLHPAYFFYLDVLARQNLVTTIHDLEPHPGEAYTPVVNILQRLIIRTSRHLIVHGHTIKERLAKKYNLNPSTITVAPLGILSGQTGRNYTVQPHSILFFGRIVDYKGLDTLLQSLILLQRKQIPFYLTIAGSGSLKRYQSLLDQIPQKTVVNRYIPEDQLNNYFASTEIVVLPYKEASQSAVLSIALGYGKPIIATNVGAFSEILENGSNALLIEPERSQLLASSLERLLTNLKLRERLAQAARQTAITQLSWPKIVRCYLQAYRHVI